MLSLSTKSTAFMESGVSIVVASHDTKNRPYLGHAAGCRVEAGGQSVKVFLSPGKYALLIDAIRRSGVISASFSEPSSNASLQVKGVSPELVPLQPSDLDIMKRYLDLFTADLTRIGLRGELARAAISCAENDLVAIAFAPNAIFEQTPGPKAGERIKA